MNGHDGPLDSLWLICLPDAISISQYPFGPGSDLRVDIEEIASELPAMTELVDNLHNEPRIRIGAHERWSLTVRKRSVRRVAMPPDPYA